MALHTRLISPIQAYMALFEILKSNYEQKATDSVGILLGSMSLLVDGSSADPATWPAWLESIDTIVEIDSDGVSGLPNHKLEPMIVLQNGCYVPEDGYVDKSDAVRMPIDRGYDVAIVFVNQYMSRSEDDAKILGDMFSEGQNRSESWASQQWRSAIETVTTAEKKASGYTPIKFKFFR